MEVDDEYYRRSYGKLRLWRECKSFCLDKRRFSLNQEAPASTSGGVCSQDTIEMMTSIDYKDRFKAEYYQLEIRAYEEGIEL